MLRIDGKIYKKSDLNHVSALLMFKASEELPTLGLKTTWDDLVALMERSTLPPAEQGHWSSTDATWMLVIAIWATLNASGRETSLLDAMDHVSGSELIEGPDDHQGKAKAPTSRKGSGRGAAPVRKAVAKTPS
jgi:hypothetical protein